MLASKIRFLLLLLLLPVFYYLTVSCTSAGSHSQSGVDSVKIGYSIVASNLEVPWEIIWGPDNWIWYSEQNGSISKVNPETGQKKQLLKLHDYYRKRLGLLSMVLHPDIKRHPHIFLYYSSLKGEKVYTNVVRYTWRADSLVEPKVLLEIPAASGHMGGRLAISDDRKLMLATGDYSDPKNVQNPNTINGKVLRMNLDGSVPKDNPHKGSYMWAKGFRVPQGLAYGSNGSLYTSEHGDANDDEVNLIKKGANYGFPNVTGILDLDSEKAFAKSNKVTDPLIAWTPTVAPSSIDYYNSPEIPQWKHSLLVTTLKESDLRVLKLNEAGDKIISETVILDGQFGRLRDVFVSPRGEVYIATSNRDWNRTNKYSNEKDDRIIRVAPFRRSTGETEILAPHESGPKPVADKLAGKILYTQYCVSCHKDDGSGISGVFPPLKGAEQVSGDKAMLIDIVLNGLTGPIKVLGKEYNQPMPAFKFLKDQEIAEILTYVRSNFSEIPHAEVSAEEVRQARVSTAK